MNNKDLIRKTLFDHIKLIESISTYISLIDQILGAANCISRSLGEKKKVLIFGNGGSAADAQHIAAELIVRFKEDRDPIPAISLTTDASILTAISNDYDFEDIFRRQILALGNSGDVAIAISTSGESINVLRGVSTAKGNGLSVIGLLGHDGGSIGKCCDYPIIIPSIDTARIQEAHVLVYHIICELVEKNFLKLSEWGKR